MVAPMAGARRLPFGRFVLFDALGALLWAAAFVAIGYAAGANLGALQHSWAGLTVLMQVLVAVAVVAFVVIRLVGATRFTMAVGATLITIATVKPATPAGDTLDAAGPRGKPLQAIVRL